MVQGKNSCFSRVSIKKYKLFKNIDITSLKRINLFAGINNTGKSSLFEAIYLLATQNDIYALFETIKRRGKFCTSMNNTWLDSQFKEDIEIEGIFDNQEASVHISRQQEEDEDFDKSGYLSTIKIDSRYRDENLSSRARVFQNKENQYFFKNIKWICNIVFSNPFAIHNTKDLVRFHEKSVETKSIDRIIDFLKQFVDTGIEDIELAGDFKRFLVRHKNFPNALDLTQFGEGMQRIFHITFNLRQPKMG